MGPAWADADFQKYQVVFRARPDVKLAMRGISLGLVTVTVAVVDSAREIAARIKRIENTKPETENAKPARLRRRDSLFPGFLFPDSGFRFCIFPNSTILPRHQ